MVVTTRVPAEAVTVANKSVAVNPLMLGVVPESDNSTKLDVFAVKELGIVIVSARVLELKRNKKKISI